MNTGTNACHDSTWLDDILQPDFWLEFAPGLRIGHAMSCEPFAVTDEERIYVCGRLLEDGYGRLGPGRLQARWDDLANLFTALVGAGAPPVFAFVYDEIWSLSYQLRNLVSAALSENCVMLPTFWAEHVGEGETGWPPHRDKSSDCLYQDRRPKSLSVWIPITVAEPENGCTYVLPATRDDAYGFSESQLVDRVTDIRALPAKPGDVLFWTQHLLHWGSRAAADHSLPPCMNVALEFQRDDVEAHNTPLLRSGAPPSFDERLALIAKQLLQRRHLHEGGAGLSVLAEAILERKVLPNGD